MDATATDRVRVHVDGRTADPPPRYDDPPGRRAGVGVTIPTLCNYRGLDAIALRVSWWRSKPRVGDSWWRRAATIENNLVVHTEETATSRTSRGTVLENCSRPRRPIRELAELAASWASRPPAAEGKCILCGLAQ